MAGRYKVYHEAENPLKPVNGAVWDDTGCALVDTKEVWRIAIVDGQFVSIKDKGSKLDNGKIVRLENAI